MTLDEFKAMCRQEEFPARMNPLLQALWYDTRVSWDTDHHIVQEIPEPDGSSGSMDICIERRVNWLMQCMDTISPVKPNPISLWGTSGNALNQFYYLMPQQNTITLKNQYEKKDQKLFTK
jgi:hypothetical protein